jgi:single-stranded-DNA-specific exonuclease
VPIFDEWVVAAPPERAARLPIANAAIHDIFVRRGVTDADQFRQFAAPVMEDLHDPSSIHGIGQACDRIAAAIRDGESILIYGDYDVDGVTSIVLLQTVLRAIGAKVNFVVPHRLVDGYGLKLEVLERVLETESIKLVITVDCGITSVEPVERALERGIDVIVTDHHLPPGTLPAAASILNPKQPGCDYPFKDLAGVGVALKLCCELLRRAGSKISIASLVKIAAIGTIADVAPLTGENRAIASIGLRGLADPRNPGLRSLIRRLGLYGRPLRSSDIGFKIGPRLNAAGRLASANTAIELFHSATEEAAEPLVTELERLNHERQQVELLVREAAQSQIDPEEAMLILAGQGWHKGVLGLSAGRVAQSQHRPTLMISIEGDRCVGSGRSIPTINLHALLSEAADLFTHFGGHDFACGFSFPASRLPELRARLSAAAARIPRSSFQRGAPVDAVVSLGELDRELLAAHEQLQPFGAGNAQPLFGAHEVTVVGRREFSPGCYELTLADATGRATAVVWPSAAAVSGELAPGRSVDLLFQVEPDNWTPSGLRLTVVDASRPGERLRNVSSSPPVALPVTN